MSPKFPDRYHTTAFVLLVVDPLHVYAYWEVTPESVRQAQNALGAEMDGARAVIRMYDISLITFDDTNAHHTFDIDIGLEVSGWYLPLWSTEKSYLADLGFVTRTGRFHKIVRSNIIHTPRDHASWRTEERWMRVRFLRRRKPDRQRSPAYVSGPPLGLGLSPEESGARQELVTLDTLSKFRGGSYAASSGR